MSLTASARSVCGTSRQDVLIDGRHHLTTDEPVHLGGTDLGPAPHELLPASLASCISLTLVTYARTKNWDIGEVSVDVVYDNKSVPRRFDVAIEVGGNLNEAQLARLRKVAAACPLRRSLETGFEFEERLGHREPVVRALLEERYRQVGAGGKLQSADAGIRGCRESLSEAQ